MPKSTESEVSQNAPLVVTFWANSPISTAPVMPKPRPCSKMPSKMKWSSARTSRDSAGVARLTDTETRKTW